MIRPAQGEGMRKSDDFFRVDLRGPQAEMRCSAENSVKKMTLADMTVLDRPLELLQICHNS